jgi:hypothetical protein
VVLKGGDGNLLLLLLWCSTEGGWWLEAVVLDWLLASKKKNSSKYQGKKKNGSDLHVLTLWTNMKVFLFYKISTTAADFYHLSPTQKGPILLSLDTSH